MADDFAAFDVPEFDRIGQLLNDLHENGNPSAPSKKIWAVVRPGPGKRGRRRAARTGSATLAAFGNAVNWRNAADFANPLLPAAAAPVGGKTVAAFAAAVNWRNAVAVEPAVPAADATPTLDTFLSEFNWD